MDTVQDDEGRSWAFDDDGPEPAIECADEWGG